MLRILTTPERDSLHVIEANYYLLPPFLSSYINFYVTARVGANGNSIECHFSGSSESAGIATQGEVFTGT